MVKVNNRNKVRLKEKREIKRKSDRSRGEKRIEE